MCYIKFRAVTDIVKDNSHPCETSKMRTGLSYILGQDQKQFILQCCVVCNLCNYREMFRSLECYTGLGIG